MAQLCQIAHVKLINTLQQKRVVERKTTKRNHMLLFLVFLVAWTCLTILAVNWGTRFDWPDNVHVDYGLPLVWSTQTLSTIVGPTNIWTVDPMTLMIDLIFWLAIMLIIAPLLLYFLNKEK
jgi:hypothetical protein